MWNLFLKFVLNVAAHWITVAGVVLTVAAFFDHYIEELAKRESALHKGLAVALRLLAKNLKFIALACLVVGCFQAWTDEHHNTEEAINGPEGKIRAWSLYNQCDKERFGKSTLVDSLETQTSFFQRQIGNQQDVFNKCILALGLEGARKPAVASIRIATLDSFSVILKSKPDTKIKVVVVRVDQLRKTVNGQLACSSPMQFIEAHLASSETLRMGGNGSLQINDYTVNVNITGEPWSPDDDLILLIVGDNISAGACTFKLL